MKPLTLGALLSFNAGFVDATGFIGLDGLFAAHVTGNFVTLGAALVLGTHGTVSKLLALPEFIAVVMLARLAGAQMRARGLPALRILLAVKVALLLLFCVLAVAWGSFPDADAPRALVTGFVAVAAMALQNAIQRTHFQNLPPSTVMTNNVTQAALDCVDLLHGVEPDRAPVVRRRFSQLLVAMVFFAAGCVAAAGLYAAVGFWCLVIPVGIGAITAIFRAEA